MADARPPRLDRPPTPPTACEPTVDPETRWTLLEARVDALEAALAESERARRAVIDRYELELEARRSRQASTDEGLLARVRQRLR